MGRHNVKLIIPLVPPKNEVPPKKSETQREIEAGSSLYDRIGGDRSLSKVIVDAEIDDSNKYRGMKDWRLMVLTAMLKRNTSIREFSEDHEHLFRYSRQYRNFRFSYRQVRRNLLEVLGETE